MSELKHLETSEVEVTGPGGTGIKGKGPVAVGSIIILILALSVGWFVRKDILSMSKEHIALTKKISSMESNQDVMIRILQQQTELYKLQMELMAKDQAKRQEFLDIYKNSPTWKEPARRERRGTDN